MTDVEHYRKWCHIFPRPTTDFNDCDEQKDSSSSPSSSTFLKEPLPPSCAPSTSWLSLCKTPDFQGGYSNIYCCLLPSPNFGKNEKQDTTMLRCIVKKTNIQVETESELNDFHITTKEEESRAEQKQKKKQKCIEYIAMGEIRILHHLRQHSLAKQLQQHYLLQKEFSLTTPHLWYWWKDTPTSVSIAMEDCGSMSLFDLVERLQFQPLPLDTIKHISRQLVFDLLHCHRMGVYHLDVKPENVVVKIAKNFSYLPNQIHVSLIDFGLAILYPYSTNDFVRGGLISSLRSKTVLELESLYHIREPWCRRWCGSTAYLPPEIAETRPFAPALCDTWTLGMTIWVMLFGNLPIENDAIVFGEGKTTTATTTDGIDCMRNCLMVKARTRRQSCVYQGFSRLKLPYQVDDDDVEDLLHGLLQRDVRARWSIFDVLAHPWFITMNI